MSKRTNSHLENRTIAALKVAGYQCFRAVGTESFDVVGLSANEMVLIKVKNNDLPTNDEINFLLAAPSPPNARKLFHIWRHRERLPSVRDVTSGKVELL